MNSILPLLVLGDKEARFRRSDPVAELLDAMKALTSSEEAKQLGRCVAKLAVRAAAMFSREAERREEKAEDLATLAKSRRKGPSLWRTSGPRPRGGRLSKPTPTPGAGTGRDSPRLAGGDR